MNPGEKERTVTKYSKQEMQTSNICGKIPYETRTNNLSRSISCETYAMNRGHEGTDIFYGNKNKSQFLDYLADAKTKMKIKIFAYCVMDTHYHLVLENSNGKMSEFMKRLNGQYGSYYRMVSGGKGYVFQDRFKSTLIEKDAYLLQSIAYLLRNPLRAGIVRNVEDYIWSSIKTYYSDNGPNWPDP